MHPIGSNNLHAIIVHSLFWDGCKVALAYLGLLLTKNNLNQAKSTAGVSYVLRSNSKQVGSEGKMQPLPHTVIRPPIDPSKADKEAVQHLILALESQVCLWYILIIFKAPLMKCLCLRPSISTLITDCKEANGT